MDETEQETTVVQQSFEVVQEVSQQSTTVESFQVESTQESSVSVQVASTQESSVSVEHTTTDSDMADLPTPAEQTASVEEEQVEMETAAEPVAEPAVLEEEPVEESAPVEEAYSAEQEPAILEEEPAAVEVVERSMATEVADPAPQEVASQAPVSFDTTVKESDWHTWRPRGTYNVPKCEVKFDDMKTTDVPDVEVKDHPKPVPPPVPQEEEPQYEPVEMVDQFSNQPTMMNGEMISPSFDIPLGIPLLARVLPKEEGDTSHESIPLERLFTPATDSGDITPKKKKVFSSSCFYAPNHPTVEDQVTLAQRISTSLIDENNKMSRGQTMYIKRKKRSDKWVHQAGADGEDFMQVPQMQMQMQMQQQQVQQRSSVAVSSSKTVSEHSEVEHHLHQVSVAGQPMFGNDQRMNKAPDVQPTGRGAELFAKRKKRMDQFIVDETNVQRSSVHNQQSSVLSESESSSSSSTFQQSTMKSSQVTSKNVSQTTSGGAQFLRSTCTAVQPTLNSTVMGGMAEGAPVYTAEVKVVQRASLPNTPTPSSFEITLPEGMQTHSLLEHLEEASKQEKRLSFNLAAKGWGTYNKFYSPVTFTAG